MIQNMKERQEREAQRVERESKRERTERDHSGKRRHADAFDKPFSSNDRGTGNGLCEQ